MTASHVKLKVGIVFIVAVAVLFAGILWLKEYRPAGTTVRVRVLFGNSLGVAAGDPVVVSGVRVGNVEHVGLTPENRALVSIALDRTVNLRADASFEVREAGLMGEREIDVNPGSAPEALDVSKPVAGTRGSGIASLTTGAEDAIGRFVRLTARVDSGLDVGKTSASLEETLAEVRQAVGGLRAMAERTGKPLNETIANLNAAAGDIRRFVGTNEMRAARAADGVEAASGRVSALADSLSSLAAVMDTLASRLETGEGTFAKLVRSGDLYDDLRRTNATIDSFVTDFRKNPRKYTKDMTFKLRLF